MFALVLWGSSASAVEVVYSMTNTARQFTGQQLEIPITGPATGTGFLRQQVGGPIPIPLTVSNAQLDRPKTPSTDPLFLGGGAALQLKTSLAIQVPPRGVIVNFVKSGRSGPPVLSFCPGGNDTANGKSVFSGAAPYNPNCTVVASSGAAGGGIGTANGIMQYSKTTNQFGGFGAVAAQGTASLAVWLALPLNNPTTTNGNFGQVAFAGDVIDISGVGEPIDDAPNTGKLEGLAIKKLLGYTPSGIITSVGATLLAASDLQQTAWPGPLTTGQLKISVTANQGPIPSIFTISGSDTRDAAGIGNITLVGGSVSRTNLTGSSTTRNVISFSITPEPTMLLGASCALGALLVSHRVTRRRAA
jgi:hypothetical protein